MALTTARDLIIGTSGTNDTELEQWDLEGCFLQNVDYSDGDYAVSEPVQVILTLKYDNAIHTAPGDTIFPFAVNTPGGELT